MAAFDMVMKVFSFLSLRRKVSLMKIKAAKAYVVGVKKTRVFLLGAMLVLVSLVFLADGLSLAHTALFVFSGWSDQTKFTVALLLGIGEFLVAMGILWCLFREETWVRFTHITKVVNAVVGKREGKPK
jgi:hypothetical protein